MLLELFGELFVLGETSDCYYSHEDENPRFNLCVKKLHKGAIKIYTGDSCATTDEDVFFGDPQYEVVCYDFFETARVCRFVAQTQIFDLDTRFIGAISGGKEKGDIEKASNDQLNELLKSCLKNSKEDPNFFAKNLIS
jgi:hypothetical protein